jgi:hypothetical protein
MSLGLWSYPISLYAMLYPKGHHVGDFTFQNLHISILMKKFSDWVEILRPNYRNIC